MTLESALAHDEVDTQDVRDGAPGKGGAAQAGLSLAAPTHVDATRFTSRVGATSTVDTSRWIGSRMRSIREQKQMSLVDVERLSGGDLGTSTVGAYERGDRAITIPRLDQIADFYGVPIEQFLPQPEGETPITTRTSPILEALRIDTAKLDPLDGTEFVALRRYIVIIREQRADSQHGAITLRGADAVVVAAMFSVSTESIIDRLRALDLLDHGTN